MIRPALLSGTVYQYSATVIDDPPPPGTELLAIDVVSGGPRVRLRISNVLANDILRISRGAADALATSIQEARMTESTELLLESLRDRLAYAEAVIRLSERGMGGQRAADAVEGSPFDDNPRSSR